MRFLAYYKFEMSSCRRDARRLVRTECAIDPFPWDLLDAENSPNIPIYVQIKNYGCVKEKALFEFCIYGKEGFISSIGISKEHPNYGICLLPLKTSRLYAMFFDFKGFSMFDGKPIRGSVIEAFVVRVNYPTIENTFRRFCNGGEPVSREMERIKRYILIPIVPKDVETVSK